MSRTAWPTLPPMRPSRPCHYTKSYPPPGHGAYHNWSYDFPGGILGATPQSSAVLAPHAVESVRRVHAISVLGPALVGWPWPRMQRDGTDHGPRSSRNG